MCVWQGSHDDVTLKPDSQTVTLMGSYGPQKFLGLLAPTQRESDQTLSRFSCESLSTRDWFQSDQRLPPWFAAKQLYYPVDYLRESPGTSYLEVLAMESWEGSATALLCEIISRMVCWFMLQPCIPIPIPIPFCKLEKGRGLRASYVSGCSHWCSEGTVVSRTMEDCEVCNINRCTSHRGAEEHNL